MHIKPERHEYVQKTLARLLPDMDANRERVKYQADIECSISTPSDYDQGELMLGYDAAYLLAGDLWQDLFGYHVLGEDDDFEGKTLAEFDYATAPVELRNILVDKLYEGRDSPELTLDDCYLRGYGFHEFSIDIIWMDIWDNILEIPAVKKIWPSAKFERDGKEQAWDGRFNFRSTMYLGNQHVDNAARIFAGFYQQAFDNFYDGQAKIMHIGI